MSNNRHKRRSYHYRRTVGNITRGMEYNYLHPNQSVGSHTFCVDIARHPQITKDSTRVDVHKKILFANKNNVLLRKEGHKARGRLH